MDILVKMGSFQIKQNLLNLKSTLTVFRRQKGISRSNVDSV